MITPNRISLALAVILAITTHTVLKASPATTMLPTTYHPTKHPNAVPTTIFSDTQTYTPLIDEIFSLPQKGQDGGKGSAEPTTQDRGDEYDFYRPYPSDAHDMFSWRLMTEVLTKSPGNAVISPFTVKLVLAMLSEASGNNSRTQQELHSTLQDISQPDNLRNFYKKTLSYLRTSSAYHTLNLETKLFTDEFIEPQQKFAGTLQHFYQTEIQRLPFTDTTKSADTINAWCENATGGHIKQLVNEQNVENSVMLMASAIYFKGLWRREFDEVFAGVFHPSERQRVKVNYMEQTDYFYYHESKELSAKILRLPYRGNSFSMFMVLPNSGSGDVDTLIARMNNKQVKSMQWAMEETKVKVVVPKFKFDFSKRLKDSLQKLGVSEIFTEQASLPGLARGSSVSGSLKVSDIFQKSGIEISEKGTEAFAATVVEIENKFGGSTMKEFYANRPFLFFIEEETTGNIIFAGKLSEPQVLAML